MSRVQSALPTGIRRCAYEQQTMAFAKLARRVIDLHPRSNPVGWIVVIRQCFFFSILRLIACLGKFNCAREYLQVQL